MRGSANRFSAGGGFASNVKQETSFASPFEHAMGSTPIKILERMIDNYGLSLKLYETVPIIIQVLLAITSFESQL